MIINTFATTKPNNMTSFIYFLGDCCTAFFKHMPAIGRGINMFLFTAGFIGGIYWIYYMITDPKNDKNYLSKD